MSPSSDSSAVETAEPSGAGRGAAAETVVEQSVVLPANLHARPAGRLARAAARFASSIRVRHGARSVDPTGVLAVMSLGATAGATVTVRAQGPDAEQAVRALVDVLIQAE